MKDQAVNRVAELIMLISVTEQLLIMCSCCSLQMFYFVLLFSV